MRTEAQVVRSTMKRAYKVIGQDEDAHQSSPYPRQYHQSFMARLLNRADPETARAIAIDMDNVAHRIDVEALIIRYRQREDNEASPRRRGSRVQIDQLLYSLELKRLALAQFTRDEYLLFETGVRLPWKHVARYWRGRVWHSLRDDWEGLACAFWNNHKRTIDEAVQVFCFTPSKISAKSAIVTEGRNHPNSHVSGSI